MVKVQASHKCNIAEAKDHGWLWIMCTAVHWLLKLGITAQVPILTNPGLYQGNTNSLHSAYKQKLKLYAEYAEHKRNTNKAIQAYFNEDLFVELETDMLLLRITPLVVYQHIWTSFLLKMDKDQEILKKKELLKVDYDPDWIVQRYYKQVNKVRQLVTALNETVINAEIIRNAYTTYKTGQTETCSGGITDHFRKMSFFRSFISP